MLIALPVTTFAAITIHLHSRRSDSEVGSDWRDSFLLASIIWGTLLVAITEGLSLFSAITRTNVAILWAIALCIMVWIGIRQGTFRSLITDIKPISSFFNPIEWLIVIGIGLILIALALVAWIAPPNTTDSLLYHLSRVAHWIQNSNLRHYPTAYRHQLWASPFAEMSILNLQILWGSDQPANMIQWFSLLGSLLGVTSIAKLMGAGHRGQLISAVFVLSIPMAVLQATSSQTDLVTAYWLICLVYLVLISKRRSLSALEEIALSLSASLGILTKGTAYPLALPILLWYFCMRLIDGGFKKSIRAGITFVVIVTLLNGSFWARNVASFGSPLGPKDAIDQHTELSLNAGEWISTLLRHIVRNYATPWEGVNTRVASGMDSIQEFLGVEGEHFELVWAWNHEDYAGSPIHMTALLLLIVIVEIFRRRISSSVLKEYVLVLLCLSLLFGIVVQASLYSNRLQLPILMLGAPAIGAAFSQFKSRPLDDLLLILLLSISLPWVLFNSIRPIIGMRPGREPWAIDCALGCTRTGSIFFRSREDLYFANLPEYQEPITTVAKIVENSGCKRVGLALDSHDGEYLFWWSLDALENNIRLETIFTYPELEKYLDPTFEPCAVICTLCGSREEAYGLELQYNRQSFSLFMGEGYSPEMDP